MKISEIAPKCFHFETSCLQKNLLTSFIYEILSSGSGLNFLSINAKQNLEEIKLSTRCNVL